MLRLSPAGTARLMAVGVAATLLLGACSSGSASESAPPATTVVAMGGEEGLEISLRVSVDETAPRTSISATATLTNLQTAPLTLLNQGCAGPVGVSIRIDPPTATSEHEQLIVDEILESYPDRGFSIPFAPSDDMDRCADELAGVPGIATTTELAPGESIEAGFVFDGAGRTDVVIDPGAVEVVASLKRGGAEAVASVSQSGTNQRWIGPGEAVSLMAEDPELAAWLEEGVPVGDPNFVLGDGEWTLRLNRLAPLPLMMVIRLDARSGEVIEVVAR